MNHKLSALLLCISSIISIGYAHANELKDDYFKQKFAQANYSEQGAKQCQQCHQQAMQGFLDSVHGSKADIGSPAAGLECEACHGPLGQHAQDPINHPMVKHAAMEQANLSASMQNKLCLRCHGDQFPLETTPCAACHSDIHSDNAIPDTQKQSLACLECHPQLQKQVRMPYNHGLVDDKGTNILQGCSTQCHAAHGSKWAPAYQTPNTNAPCLDCHVEKQGPFKVEHAGFKLQCSACHDPHGTMDEHLLRPNIDKVCSECHGEINVLEAVTSDQVHGHN